MMTVKVLKEGTFKSNLSRKSKNYINFNRNSDEIDKSNDVDVE